MFMWPTASKASKELSPVTYPVNDLLGVCSASNVLYICSHAAIPAKAGICLVMTRFRFKPIMKIKGKRLKRNFIIIWKWHGSVKKNNSQIYESTDTCDSCKTLMAKLPRIANLKERTGIKLFVRWNRLAGLSLADKHQSHHK